MIYIPYTVPFLLNHEAVKNYCRLKERVKYRITNISAQDSTVLSTLKIRQFMFLKYVQESVEFLEKMKCSSIDLT